MFGLRYSRATRERGRSRATVFIRLDCGQGVEARAIPLSRRPPGIAIFESVWSLQRQIEPGAWARSSEKERYLIRLKSSTSHCCRPVALPWKLNSDMKVKN